MPYYLTVLYYVKLLNKTRLADCAGRGDTGDSDRGTESSTYWWGRILEVMGCRPTLIAASPASSAFSSQSKELQSKHKRDGYLSWQDYFMSIAYLSAKRSKDPRTQVGACIVNSYKRIVGIGYNGMPDGCHDDQMPWGREGDALRDQKRLFVCHAELNAVLNKFSADIKGCTMYVTLFPCNECTKLIIQSGIKQIYYLSDSKSNQDSTKAAKIMLNMAHVKYEEYRPKMEQPMVINFDDLETKTGKK